MRKQIDLVSGEGKLGLSKWVPVYIHGRPGFRDAVQSKLHNSWLQGAPEVASTLIMYWLHDAESRKFKLAIGSKIIFKFRLHFFMNLNEYVSADKNLNTGLSLEENKMVQKMIAWEEGRTTPTQQNQLEQDLVAKCTYSTRSEN